MFVERNIDSDFVVGLKYYNAIPYTKDGWA